MQSLIHRSNIGEILQRIYDSEIHLSIAWLWDGGVSYSLDGNPNVLDCKYQDVMHSCSDKMEEVFGIILVDVMTKYPKSEFTKWANSTDLSIFKEDD
jgi:hypothetical protein